jgi:hypothetical protein
MLTRMVRDHQRSKANLREENGISIVLLAHVQSIDRLLMLLLLVFFGLLLRSIA